MPEKFADNSNLMQLGFGVSYPDLYEREGLIRLDRAFVACLAEADRSLAEQHNELAPLYSVKRQFVQRRALHKVKPADVQGVDAAALARQLFGGDFTEL